METLQPTDIKDAVSVSRYTDGELTSPPNEN